MLGYVSVTCYVAFLAIHRGARSLPILERQRRARSGARGAVPLRLAKPGIEGLHGGWHAATARAFTGLRASSSRVSVNNVLCSRVVIGLHQRRESGCSSAHVWLSHFCSNFSFACGATEHLARGSRPAMPTPVEDATPIDGAEL